MEVQYTPISVDDDEQNSVINLMPLNNNSTVINIDENDNTTNNHKKTKISFFGQFLIKKVYVTALYSFLALIGINIVYSAIVGSYIDKQNTNEEEIEKMSKEHPVLIGMYASLIGPILEELFFRKLTFGLLKRLSLILAYLLSSFLFAFGHFGFSFSLLIEEILFFPIYFFAGIVLAYAYNHDGFILTSMLTHIMYNSTMLLLQYLIEDI
ncbi:Abi-domain-containing protein [Neocallimastix lanati (nom. inval.)]|jgi:membrane protease YdiL (CAAX protease family)|uniref:Abi-domain-containing protein n=1 Tax=Neocallimastix californiae TaxID=1754190 RepID=A0A1Y2C4X5_9FUNG|nr:Abi-domain-containing protein [Neocallimastix sp. JGI-2020a]ORY42092.1 Abi-domain-containing protein [Neocallimastix californiae]|eukprot:ORY42092.1 Abi-domain-containing protein [Neocallimastix californiae]